MPQTDPTATQRPRPARRDPRCLAPGAGRPRQLPSGLSRLRSLSLLSAHALLLSQSLAQSPAPSKPGPLLPENDAVQPVPPSGSSPANLDLLPTPPLEQEAGWTSELLRPRPPNPADFLLKGEPTPGLRTEFEDAPPSENRGTDWAAEGVSIQPQSGMSFNDAFLLPEGLRFRLGDLELRPLVHTSITANDNIFQTATQKHSDTLSSLTLGVLGAHGDYLQRKDSYLLFGYAPNALLYARRSDLNAFNQSARFDGQQTFHRWTLGGRWAFDQATQPLRDLGQRLEIRIHSAELRSSFEVSENLRTEGVLNRTLTSISNGFQSEDLSARLAAFHRWSQKSEAGLATVFGQINPSNGSSASYLQPQTRFQWSPLEKLKLRGVLGIDLRQFSSGIPLKTTPLFDLAASWTPQPRTDLSLSLRRDIANSAAASDIQFVSSGLYAGARQRIGRSLEAEVLGSYENFSYFSSAKSPLVAALAQRVDRTQSARFRLSYLIPPTSSLSAFYLQRKNDSRIETFGFQNHQLGLEWRTNF
jgi:hypothetical protein